MHGKNPAWLRTPDVLKDFPGEQMQSLIDAEPVNCVVNPDGQIVQSMLDAVSLYEPAEHGLHFKLSPVPDAKYPRAQTQSAELLAITSGERTA